MSLPDPRPKEPPETSPESNSASDWNRLRSLLLGAEQASLKSLVSKIGDRERLLHSLADALPEAAALRARKDDRLTQALAPVINDGLEQSVRRNPQLVVDALYPIMGPAIRRSISEALAEMMHAFNRALEQSLSLRALKWRFDAWRTGQPYAKVVLLNTLIYRVEQVFLIHRDTGLLLSHVSAPEVSTQDPSLVSGMLTAIRDFIGDSFDLEKTQEGLETVRLGELTVQVQVGPRAVLAAVVRGNAPDTVRVSLSETLELVHRSHAVALARFNGDMEPFANLTGELERCLSAQRRSTGHSAWQTVMSLLVVGALFAWLGVVQHQKSVRWTAIVDAVSREPGYTIIEDDRGSRRIRALRDPLARQPSDVVGARSHQVLWELKPYISTEAPLVIARARVLLNAPPGVDLRLSGGKLVASGRATDDWLATARTRALFVPGVMAFDYGQVKVVDRDALTQARRTLLAAALYFDPGSRVLTPVQTEMLDRLLPSLRILQAAAAQGNDIVVNIVGRADAPGTTEYNLRLSEARAEAVRRYLLRNDVPDTLIRARGVGVLDAGVTGRGEADEAERRVDFAVSPP
jgi:outer membrane protein OmpA-like peptidoglycan-associated protein